MKCRDTDTVVTKLYLLCMFKFKIVNKQKIINRGELANPNLNDLHLPTKLK